MTGAPREVEHRRCVSDGDQDVHTAWRRVLAYTTNRSGTTAKLKRASRRRERREGRAELRAGDDA